MFFVFDIRNLQLYSLFSSEKSTVRDSIVASTSACHADNRGSIPRLGEVCKKLAKTLWTLSRLAIYAIATDWMHAVELIRVNITILTTFEHNFWKMTMQWWSKGRIWAFRAQSPVSSTGHCSNFASLRYLSSKWSGVKLLTKFGDLVWLPIYAASMKPLIERFTNSARRSTHEQDAITIVTINIG